MSLKTRQKWLTELNERPNDPFKLVDGSQDKIFCRNCVAQFSATQLSVLKAHLNTSKHKQNTALRRSSNNAQAQLSEVIQPPAAKKSRSNIVGLDLCKAFLAADIPMWKLRNKTLKDCLERNMSITLPCDASMRSKYVPESYQEAISQIKEDLQDVPIWICIDETQNSQGKYVANILMGKLDKDCYHAPHLVHSCVMEKVNADTMSQLCNDTIRDVLPGFKAENLKLFVSDQAPYMMKCAKNLKPLYPAMLIISCIVHGLHRVCETIREMLPQVNELIASTKQVFRKAPARCSLFMECNPGLHLPPEPVVTC